jgi:transposase
MDVIHERCAGLDVHTLTVVACAVTPGPRGRPHEEVRTFGTTSEALLQLADWLRDRGVGAAALEATGVYWRPVWNVLEAAGLDLLLANPQHIKAVPGRKTDVRDCEWLADRLRHGLLKGSFVPARPQRQLRDLVRSRTALLQERTAEVNRLHKTLEAANVKLASVASAILGQSGRDILAALVAGVTDVAALAEFARGRLRAKLPQRERALAGRFGLHQRFLVAQQLAHVDALEETLGRVSAEIAVRLRPHAATLERLDAIPGGGRRTAEVLLAEVGPDVARFPDAAHLASWAGRCPGNHARAGKRRSGRTRKGNPWLRTALVEAGQAAGRTKHTYLGARYRRLVGRRGKQRAALALGHAILTTAYALLRRPAATYQDLGEHYVDQRARRAVERRLVQRLEGLGYRVALEPLTA